MNKDRMKRLFGEDWEEEKLDSGTMILSISNVKVLSQRTATMTVVLKENPFCDEPITAEDE